MSSAKIDKDKLIAKMEAYFGEDKRRIKHAHTVADYALEIHESAGGDYNVILAAGALHDIGIHEAERKYQSCAGRYQEIEGPPIARDILEQMNVAEEIINEVCEIIAHHHNPGIINTLNFRTLYDADMLVNLGDEGREYDKDKMQRIIDKTFLTPAGKKIAQELFL